MWHRRCINQCSVDESSTTLLCSDRSGRPQQCLPAYETDGGRPGMTTCPIAQLAVARDGAWYCHVQSSTSSLPSLDGDDNIDR